MVGKYIGVLATEAGMTGTTSCEITETTAGTAFYSRRGILDLLGTEAKACTLVQMEQPTRLGIRHQNQTPYTHGHMTSSTSGL